MHSVWWIIKQCMMVCTLKPPRALHQLVTSLFRFLPIQILKLNVQGSNFFSNFLSFLSFYKAIIKQVWGMNWTAFQHLGCNDTALEALYRLTNLNASLIVPLSWQEILVVSENMPWLKKKPESHQHHITVYWSWRKEANSLAWVHDNQKQTESRKGANT